MDRRFMVAAAMLLLTACGPKETVTLGVRDVPTDILLKTKSSAAPATPPAPPPPGFPFVPTPVPPGGTGGDHVPLPPAPSQSPAPPPVACPAAGPYAAAAHPATRRPAAPPRAGAYAVRVDGRYTIGGKAKASGVYGPSGVRSVSKSDPLPNGSGWRYSISDEAGLTTSYLVVPRQLPQDQTPVESQGQPVPTQAGIYVTSFVYQRADKTRLTLSTSPPLLVAKLPFTPGDKWTSHAVDQATGIGVTVNGQTGLGATYSPATARVDACGTVLDAWWVEYTVDTTPVADQAGNPEPPSQLSGPDLLVKFVGSRLAFAPQYGGLPVEESYVLDGTDAGSTLSIRRHAVYSTEPALVGSG